jgi:serine/threonine-protein kinase
MTSVHPNVDGEPERFGRFVLVRPLRKGGMGQLHVAVDSERGGVVALKRAKAGSDATRFRDEMQLARELGNHPNLVRVVDTGEIEGHDFLAMEFLRGQDLDLLVERAGRLGKRVTVPIAAAIVRQVCSALGYAHGRGIGFVHRDVKPGNVVACYDGSVKLIDHGGALSIHKRSKTDVGHAFGTVGFWAPEQKAGQPATERSDLFSAAAVFFFLLTGLPVYGQGETNDSKDALNERMKPHAPDLPRSVLTWLWRALQANPSRRFESAEEMSKALEVSTPIATAEELSAFVSHLFTVERLRDEEELQEWCKRYGPRPGEPTAVMRAVQAPTPKAGAGSTMVIGRVPRSRMPLLLVVGVVVMAGVLTAVWSQRRPDVKKASESSLTAPRPPVESHSVSPSASASSLPEPSPSEPSPPLPPQPHVANKPASPTPSAGMAMKRIQEARGLIKRGKRDTARQILAELENEPRVRGPHKVALAELAYSEGDYERAMALASQGARSGVEKDALLVRALAALKAGRPERAERDFARVIAIDPNNEDAREGRRVAQQQLAKGAP